MKGSSVKFFWRCIFAPV